MASILLSTAGAAIGASTGLPFGSIIGRIAGRTIGGLIDNSLLGGSARIKIRGSRLSTSPCKARPMAK